MFRQAELIKAILKRGVGVVHRTDSAAAGRRVMIGINHRIESIEAGEEEALQPGAPFADRIHIRQVRPELRDRAASGDAF